MSMAFDPFKAVSSERGAPMGRASDMIKDWNGRDELLAEHCRGDGHYDRGGAYWGSDNVVAVWTGKGEWCCYVEANTHDEAIRIVVSAKHDKDATTT